MFLIQLLLFALLASSSLDQGSGIDPNGIVVNAGGEMDPNGGGAMDPNGGSEVGSAIDPDGVRLCYTGCIDPNG